MRVSEGRGGILTKEKGNKEKVGDRGGVEMDCVASSAVVFILKESQ
jgi:hypothetical protein